MNKDAEYYCNLGRENIQKRDYSSAIINFDKALELAPQNIPALVDRSVAYNFLGDFEKSLDDINQVILLDPHNPIWQLMRLSIGLRQHLKD